MEEELLAGRVEKRDVGMLGGQLLERVGIAEGGADDDIGATLNEFFDSRRDLRRILGNILDEPLKLDNRVMNLLQSKGLGGCQIHNAMVYVRGGRSTYDHWANALGCTGWSYQELVPLFQQIEMMHAVEKRQDHGVTAAAPASSAVAAADSATSS